MAHLAEQVGRPEDGSSREKAEAPAEVAAGAASVEAAADAESHKKAPAEVAGSVAPAKGAAGAGQERLCPISGGGRWCILPKSKDPEAVRPKKVFGAYWPRGTAGKDPEADGGPDDKFSLAPLTERHRRCQSDSGPNKISRLRRRDLHRLVQRKLRAWMRRLRALTWPGCVRRRGWNLPHRRWQDQDEGQVDLMRLDLHKVGARSRMWGRGGCVCGRGRIPLQRGEGGHHMQEN